MWDNTDRDDSAGYSDWITDLGFFAATAIACVALGGAIWKIMS